MFTIRFVTTTVRPGLQVTLRTDVDGWVDDLPGEYENDAWAFRLPTERYVGGMTFKFVLDEQYWMAGPDLALQPVDGRTYDFGDGDVVFPGPTELVTENGVVPRTFFAPQLGEGHLYDVVVVGSGIGGGVLADQLADSGLDVLVLEAGSYLFPTHVGNLPRRHAFGPQVDKNIWSLWGDFKITNYVNAPGSTFGGAQGFLLGGRSVFWGGFIPRMSWWETDQWPTAVRWDLENFAYDLAEGLLKKATLDSDYQRRVVSGLANTLPEYVVSTAPMAVQDTDPRRRGVPGGVFSTADLLMESRLTPGTSGKDKLTVNLNHAVVKIETSGGSATGVVAHDLVSNRLRTYRGRAVVLAAGSIESAKLASLSGLDDASGKAGKGLTDHPIFFTHFAVPAGSPYFDAAAAAKVMLRHQDSGNGTPPPHVDGNRFIGIVELGTDFNQGRFVDPDILAEHVAQRGNTMLCEAVFLFNAPLQEQNGVVQNGPSAAKPQVAVAECPITPAEWATIEEVKHRIVKEVGGIALPGNDLVADRAGLGGVAHEAGTLRMDTDAAGGVVDTDLKFHAYDNLYACDLSVFPASPAANPTLTLAALSLRLARRLRAVL